MMYRAYPQDELHGWFTNAKKAAVSATKKVTRVTKKALAKAAGGVCKSAQSQVGQAGAAAAGTSPNPYAQGVSQGMTLIASICPTPNTTTMADQAAALTQTAAQTAAGGAMQAGFVPGANPGALIPVETPFYKNPWVIGGGAAAVATVAYLALKK
jgi:hypothetical protein